MTADSDFVPTYRRPIAPMRCTASKRNGPDAGERCGAWATQGTHVCAKHGANLPVVKKAAAQRVEEARMRLFHGVHYAIDTLEDVMRPGVSDAVRLKAAETWLSRAGIVAGQEITVTSVDATDPSATLRTRLDKLRETINVIEGEVLPPGGDTIAPEAQDHPEELADARGPEDGPNSAHRT